MFWMTWMKRDRNISSLKLSVSDQETSKSIDSVPRGRGIFHFQKRSINTCNKIYKERLRFFPSHFTKTKIYKEWLQEWWQDRRCYVLWNRKHSQESWRTKFIFEVALHIFFLCIIQILLKSIVFRLSFKSIKIVFTFYGGNLINNVGKT
jgi:hypothetical protein